MKKPSRFTTKKLDNNTYDMTPNKYGTRLSLNISETDNALDTSIALDVAKYFKLTAKEAATILKEILSAIAEWKTIAKAYEISKSEIQTMAKAFRV